MAELLLQFKYISVCACICVHVCICVYVYIHTNVWQQKDYTICLLMYLSSIKVNNGLMSSFSSLYILNVSLELLCLNKS